MPRYFFNIIDREMAPDDTGTECADIYAAQAEAVRASGQTLQAVAESVCDGNDWVMEVNDSHQRVLFIVRVALEDTLHLETSP